MAHNIAPVIAAERLLHHGIADDVIAAYLARTWSLTVIEQRDAIAAAHVLLRRERFDVGLGRLELREG
jgi:hypothetical protein